MEKEVEPYWEPSPEASETAEIRKKYPFHLISEHMRTRTHSQWWENDYVKEFEAEPVIKIAPSDAEKYGIEAGDTVRIFNDRGYVVMKAVINPGLRPGTLSTPRSWEGREFIDGHLQSLLTKENIYATPIRFSMRLQSKSRSNKVGGFYDSLRNGDRSKPLLWLPATCGSVQGC